MKLKKRLLLCSLILCFFSLSLVSSSAQIEIKNEEEQPVGEIFGVPVPMGNYNFVKAAILIFGNKWGPQPTTPQELEDCVWNDLVLSYEAFRRNIIVPQEEVDAEIEKTIAAEKVDFDWKKDKKAYAAWLQEKVHEPPEVFENQLRHLLQIQKLREEVRESFSPEASEEEAHQEFLNEYNTLSVELVQFDELKDAEEFYRKAKKSRKFWDNEKAKRPKDFQRPGFVSLEFLMDLWGFDKKAVYDMIKMRIGQVHGPAPVYKGYGVFKVLEKRIADESKYPQQKENYYEQIRHRKKYEALKKWVSDLKQQADIRVYKKKQ